MLLVCTVWATSSRPITPVTALAIDAGTELSDDGDRLGQCLHRRAVVPPQVDPEADRIGRIRGPLEVGRFRPGRYVAGEGRPGGRCRQSRDDRPEQRDRRDDTEDAGSTAQALPSCLFDERT